jgi:hypothetical protein
MHELMLAPPLDADDLPLTQRPCFCVGKLANDGGMKRLHFRYGLTFDGSAKPLHCFFNFGQLWHFPSETC